MNRSFHLKAAIGSLLVMAVFTAPGRGELITFQFTGSVTSVQVFESEYQSIDFPQTGDPFTGFYSFDSDNQDTDDLPVRGGFRTVLSTTAIGATIGDLQFEGLSTNVTTGSSVYYASSWIPNMELTSDPLLAQRLVINHFQLEVRRESLLDELLSLEPPSLVDADMAELRMFLDDADDFFPGPAVSIVATLDTLRLVPEPQSVLLLLAAVSGGHFFRGRHCKPAA